MRYRKTPRLSFKDLEKLNKEIEMETDPEKIEELRYRNPRATYRQYDDFGRVVYELDPYKDEKLNIPIAEKKVWVTKLFQVDDHEVYVNCKELQLDAFTKARMKAERDKFIADFERQHGCKPPMEIVPKAQRVFISLDSIPEDESDENWSEESAWIQATIASRPFETQMDAVDCMREIVKGFTVRQQEVYKLVFYEGHTRRYAAKVLELSERRVGQIADDIIRKLRSNVELRRFFRIL